MWLYGALAVLTIIAFGALTVALHNELLRDDHAALGLAIFIPTYWVARIVVDFAYHEHKDWPAGRSFVIGHALLTLLFTFLAGTNLSAVAHLVPQITSQMTAPIAGSLPRPLRGILLFARFLHPTSTMGSSTSVPRTAQMADASEKRATRTAILLLVAVFLVAGYAVEFGPQTLVWFNAKRLAPNDPWLADVPQPLPSTTPQPLPKGEPIKAYNWEFAQLWPIAKISPSVNFIEIRFKPGQSITFFDPDVQLDTLRVLKNSNPLEYQKFANLFADQPIDTNFALYQNVYGASPAQLSPFMPVRAAMRVSALLQWKLSFGTEGSAPAHSFVFGDNRGFQFGDPSSGSPIAVRVFNDRDRQFRFLFNVAAGSGAKFTQDNLNAIIASLRPVPILER